MSDETQKPEDQKDPATPPAADQKQAPTDGEKPEKPAVTFTPEQQEAINALIGEKLGKVKAKTSEEVQAAQKLVEERDALLKAYRDKEEAAAAEKEASKRKALEEKGEFEKIIAMDRKKAEDERKALEDAKAQIERERDEWRKETETTKIDNKLLSLFSAESTNPEAAVILFKAKHKITLDPTTKEVVIDGDTDNSLSSIAQQFLAANDYLSKATYAGKSGAGASASGVTAGASLTFTREQLRDPAFRKEHEAEIIKQMRVAKGG